MTTIDITQTPVSSDAPANGRSRIANQLRRLRKRQQLASLLSYVCVVIGIAVPFYFWLMEMLPEPAAIMCSLVMITALAFVISGGDGVAAVFTMANEIMAIFLFTPATTSAIITGIAMTYGLLIRFKIGCEKQIASADNALVNMTELDPSTNQDECIAFVKLCESDVTVRRYQHNLVKLNRNPTYAEYTAASRWFMEKPLREQNASKLAASHVACERLALPIAGA